MTIYLDYYLSDGKLHSIGIKIDKGTPFILSGNKLNNVIDYLIGNETIVTFGKPYYIIKNQLSEIDHILADQEINKRWTDVKVMIRNTCGLNTTISRINEAMWGKEEKLTRLEPSYTDFDNFKLEQKISEALNSLELIWETIENTGQITFMKKYETIRVDLNANTNSRDDSV